MRCVNGNLVEDQCVCYRWYYGNSCQSLFLDYWGVFFVLYIGIFFIFYYLVLLWACYELRYGSMNNLAVFAVFRCFPGLIVLQVSAQTK
jgi:hypothetical protein